MNDLKRVTLRELSKYPTGTMFIAKGNQVALLAGSYAKGLDYELLDELVLGCAFLYTESFSSQDYKDGLTLVTNAQLVNLIQLTAGVLKASVGD